MDKETRDKIINLMKLWRSEAEKAWASYQNEGHVFGKYNKYLGMSECADALESLIEDDD